VRKVFNYVRATKFADNDYFSAAARRAIGRTKTTGDPKSNTLDTGA